MKSKKPSQILEECLDGIKLLSSEKMYFDDNFDSTNIRESIFNFFNSIETRYICTNKNKIELLEAVRKFKKKTLTEEIGRRYETPKGSEGNYQITPSQILYKEKNISISVESDYSVLIQIFCNNTGNLLQDKVKKFNSEEEANLFVQNYSSKFNVK